MDNNAGEIIFALQRFRDGLHGLRNYIEDMDNDKLVALYGQVREIGVTAWYIRCLVIGTAKSRAVKGDKAIKMVADMFGITERMAQIDINVYDAFIKDDPSFEPSLPAIYYQIASRASSPKDALSYAIEQKHAGGLSIPSFRRVVKGLPPANMAEPGFYRLVPVEDEVDVTEFTHLSGKTQLMGSGDELFLRIYEIHRD